MVSVDVAVMEPKYQVNIGYIARVSKNFGVRNLIFINPRCDYKGKEAVKYSKHAVDLLRNARVCSGIGSIRSGFIIGTTGIWHKTGNAFYNVYDMKGISKLLAHSGKAYKSITVLLGRDDTGLSKDELRRCDATICIGADKGYPILNISHALAIILHGLISSYTKGGAGIYADARYQSRIFDLFDMLVKGNSRIRDKASVTMAFRHVIRRSAPTRKEINALSIALAPPPKAKRKRYGKAGI
ncbi:MAG: TrmH family RNA methyltransferase [Candidatus Micrarchaeaceae archaeon]